MEIKDETAEKIQTPVTQSPVERIAKKNIFKHLASEDSEMNLFPDQKLPIRDRNLGRPNIKSKQPAFEPWIAEADVFTSFMNF